MSVSLLAIVAIAGALAWACSPDADISIQSGAVEPGDTVTVTGAAFTAGTAASPVPANVELRWDSAGGAVLAHATGPSFVVGVRIPQTSAETHRIFAIGLDPSTGNFVGSDSEDIRVGAPPVQPAPTQGSTSAQTSGAQAGPPGAPAAGDGTPAPSRQPGDTAGRTSDSTSGREPAPDAQAARQGAPAVGIPSSTERSTATGNRSGAAAGDRAGARSSRDVATSSERSALGDAWSAFASPSARSLVGRYSEAVVPAGSGGNAAGIALLGLGLLALLAGGVVLKARGRPVFGAGQRPPSD